MLRDLESDGLYTPRIKLHSLDKIIRHDFYARVFATLMKNKWPQRCYVGLYSGPGRAQVDGSGEIVETTPMSAIRLPDPFTHYIFVDKDPRCTEALSRRIEAAQPGTDPAILTGDVNDLVPEIRRSLPHFTKEHGLISFCFVDPFAADLKFTTIRALAEYKIDFLILLMLGRDARTNFKLYYEDESNTRIADLIDCPTWREEYRTSGDSVVRFLLKKFDQAMTSLGYQSSRDALVHQVKIARKNVFLYSLVLYSRHWLGQEFWRETLTRTDPQLGFGI